MKVSMLDLYLLDRPAQPAIEARVRRMNPSFEFGMRVRGRFQAPLSWRRAKRLWQSGRFPKWCCFMAPGGKRIVSSGEENLHPGDFMRRRLPTADCPLPSSEGAIP